ncbi:MAG: SUMF1/EgtB/PvdO family nonheme iron enzyme [Deltaproteobacteria bacterium]
MRRAAVLLWVLLGGCGGCALIDQLGPDASGTASKEAECQPQALTTRPSLVGAEEAVRAAIEAGAKQHIVVVRYVQDGCGVKLEVLEDCRAPGRYAYQAEAAQSSVVVEAGTRAEHLPLAESKWTRGAVRIDVRKVARLNAPDATRLDRGGLIGSCDDATHVAMQIDIGGFGLRAGAAAALQSGDSAFTPDAPDRVGDPNDCGVADRRKRVTDGCNRALALDLVPVTNEEVELGPVEIAAGKYRLGKSSIDLAAYAIDRREVTAAAYAGCVAAGACTAAEKAERCTSGIVGKERHPINCVTAKQAEAYCAYKKQRLPTEAEWERAARGPDDGAYAWGSAWPPPEGAANLADATTKARASHWERIDGYVDGFPDTAPVSALVQYPSASGVTGAAGNVMEWTADWADRRKTARVVKGASFGHADREAARVTTSRAYDPERASAHIGFRCAREVSP